VISHAPIAVIWLGLHAGDLRLSNFTLCTAKASMKSMMSSAFCRFLWCQQKECRYHRNPRSYASRRMFEKRQDFFQLISTLFCEVMRGSVCRHQKHEVKITLSGVKISQFFTRSSFLKNICRTCANTLLLFLRFLWSICEKLSLHRRKCILPEGEK
jgi:hypothetical protein